jgi:uncharacterized Tic20 family protein
VRQIQHKGNALQARMQAQPVWRGLEAWTFEKVQENSATLKKNFLLMNPTYFGTSQTPAGPVAENERLLAILSHVLTFFAWIFAPLVIYFIKRDESAFVREHAKESLNFQLTLIIAYIVSGILVLLLVGIFLLILIGFMQLVLVIIATVRAAENQIYRYPFTIRFIQ